MRALIISLNFNPGHVSHMVASYKQCEELGYKSVYYVDSAFCPFLPKGSCVNIASGGIVFKVDLAVFLFPSQKNLPLIWKLRRQGAKVVYISLTVKWSDYILLPSEKAVKYYEENSRYTNKDYHYLPLMYSDEREERHTRMPRLYFSYIGTVAADHSFNEYLDFVEWAVTNNRLEGVNFMVGTKSKFDIPEALKNSNRITIHQGKPMTDEEINAYYSSSIAVWNAYARTTQSGVLAKSFMFGTPAVVMRANLNEFTHDGQNVVAIDDNTDKELIAAAVKRIHENQDKFSFECRKEFTKSFYYRVYNKEFWGIING